MNKSIYTIFTTTVEKFPDRTAVKYFCGQNWLSKTWAELSKDVMKVANGLAHLGADSNTNVGIISLTRLEWSLLDIACMKLGAVVTPIYHSCLEDQIAYILKDSASQIVIAEDDQQLKKIRNIQNQVPLKKIIVLETIPGGLKDNEVYFKDLLSQNHQDAKMGPQDPNKIASLVYTSGTTGEPKGAMITHDNLISVCEALEKTGIITSNDIQLIFLPLAHIFARLLEVIWILTGHTLVFSRGVEFILDDMKHTQPTFAASVPRIYEKIRNKVIQSAQNESLIKRTIANLALSNAHRLYESNSFVAQCSQSLAKNLVFGKINKKLQDIFGKRLRFFISGGAQLSYEVAMFFYACDVMICEGYGLTETSAAVSLNMPWDFKFGTVGKPLLQTEVKIAPDGEVCVKGRGVFKGFWHKEEETSQVLSHDGWFKTGDIGELDKNGFLIIKDRKKEVIVTSQGKNISPQRVENAIKDASPLISHAVVIGDDKPYLTALLTVDFSQAQEYVVNPSGKKISFQPALYECIEDAIRKSNQKLAKFEQIKKYHVLTNEFQVGVELTPTLKLKRKFCIKKFKSEIKKMYS